MRCPDWKALTLHRRRPGVPEPPGWRAALEHRDSCAACRDASVQADPTLLFAQLPNVEVEEGEITAMRERVRNLRRVQSSEDSLRRRRVGWRTMAAAAAAVVGIGLAALPGGPLRKVERRPAELRASQQAPVAAGLLPFSLPSPVEVLDGRDARVYQLMDHELAVVMIVDETLDF